MNNTLLIKGKGLSVGMLFAIVAMKLPEAAHTSIKPRWWHQNLRHELRLQNVTPEVYAVVQHEFGKISSDLKYEFF